MFFLPHAAREAYASPNPIGEGELDMPSRRFRARLAAALTLFLSVAILAPQAAPQKKKPPEEPKPEKDWKPAFVPADALEYGAELDEHAAPALKAWIHEHIAKHMRSGQVNPRAAMQAVDGRFPQTSDIARDAGAFLLQYMAYKDEDENQRVLAGRIREIDRTTYDVSRRINEIYEGEQRRLMPTTPRGAISAEQRVRLDEEVRRLEEQLRQLGTERQLKATELDGSRKKINFYLKALGLIYERMNDVPVESIAALR